jgi:hypothetical protein
MSLVLYHSTKSENARAILKEGFRDGTGPYLTTSLHTGVWLSDTPLDENEGGCSEALLEVTFNCPEADLNPFEWIEAGKGYREWLVPATFVNLHARVRIFALDRGSWVRSAHKSPNPGPFPFPVIQSPYLMLDRRS